MRYHVKERILTLKDDFVVRDDSGNDLYHVNGRLLRIKDKWSIIDVSNGQEVLFVEQRLFAYTREYDLIQNGAQLATVRMQKPGHEMRREGIFEVSTRDGIEFQIRGDFKEWDFDIVDQYGRRLGHINKEFAIMHDYYVVDVAPGVDGPFMIALAVILDEAKEDRLIK